MNGKVAKRIRKQARNKELQKEYEQNEYKSLFGRRSINGNPINGRGSTVISPLNRSFYKYLKRQYKQAA